MKRITVYSPFNAKTGTGGDAIGTWQGPGYKLDVRGPRPVVLDHMGDIAAVFHESATSQADAEDVTP